MRKIIGKVEQVGLKIEFQIRKNRLFIIAPLLFLQAMKGLYQKQAKKEDSNIKSVEIIDGVLVITYRWKEDKEAPESEEEIKQCEDEMEKNLRKAMEMQGIKIEHY